ncbi:MAG: CopG family ribbon-helix-helix protein [Solirubrobacterales bacterium]
MPASRKIIVSVPDTLLAELDRIGGVEKKNRSEMIREAIHQYLAERQKKVLREQLRKGYLEMGDINRTLAEECCGLDHEAYESGIEKLAE